MIDEIGLLVKEINADVDTARAKTEVITRRHCAQSHFTLMPQLCTCLLQLVLADHGSCEFSHPSITFTCTREVHEAAPATSILDTFEPDITLA